jgi:hypothetical protein
MADVVHIAPPDFTKAAATVAQHIETAATPPRAAAPPPAAASPVDVAAAGAAGAIQTKIGTLSGQLAPKGPAIQQAGTSAAAALAAQDAANSARMPSVPSVPTPSAPQIQALDHTWKKDPPPPPPPSDPLGRLGLPPYNPASLPSDEARKVYGIGKLRIIEQDEQLAKQGVSLEDRAKIASASRNALRSWIRTIQADQTGAAGLDQTDPNMSWDEVVKKYQDQGFTGDDLWRRIIDKSVGSRASVDDMFGIDPKNPGELPPIRPTPPGAPIISPPPNLPPIGQHPPPNPLPPNVFDHPPTTALPPTVLDHPPLPPWLQDPSPPGFQLTPSQPPPIFNWDMPDPPPAPPPMPPPAGPPVTIHMPTVAPPTPQEAGVLGTVVAVLGVLGAFVLSGGGILSGG